VLVELLALLLGRLEVVDVAHGDASSPEDVARVLGELLGGEDDERVLGAVLDERVLQDESALEVARLGEERRPRARACDWCGCCAVG